jgi:hypothetical protein
MLSARSRILSAPQLVLGIISVHATEKSRKTSGCRCRLLLNSFGAALRRVLHDENQGCANIGNYNKECVLIF